MAFIYIVFSNRLYSLSYKELYFPFKCGNSVFCFVKLDAPY